MTQSMHVRYMGLEINETLEEKGIVYVGFKNNKKKKRDLTFAYNIYQKESGHVIRKRVL